MNRAFRLLLLHALCVCALLVAFRETPAAFGQAAAEGPFRIAYTMTLRRPETHLFEVVIEVETPRAEEFVEFQMPRWSPGRYAIFDFAKNVQEFRASGDCAPAARCGTTNLAVSRVDTQTWRVRTLGGRRLRASYKVFGDDLSGTFSQFDDRHANWNGASVFMYVVGHKPDPVSLRVDAPPGWRVVNGHTAREGQVEFQFPNYDVLIDTPTEVAPDWTLDEFRVDGKLYRVVVHSFGGEGGKRAALVRDLEKIVRAQTAMWGAPEFDSYTFLIHFDPTAPRGDGMEHLNSTQLVETSALGDEGALESVLGGASHEFFHVWNVKRLRPAGLGPWDFTRPVNTRGLWIAEGFTNYYGALMRHRAGLRTEARLLDVFGRTIAYVENEPGNRLMSAEESSLLASFLDGTPHAQRVNLENTSISYYPKGEVLGLVLDLLIRGRSRGRASLDEVLRRAYDEFYVRAPQDSYYLRGRAYTNEEFFALASRVAGFDLSDFHARHARGTETPPYDEAFAYVGLRLARRPHVNEPFNAGISTDWREQQRAVVFNVRAGSAAERAGLRQGDELVSFGRTAVTAATWRGALNSFRQGDRVPVVLRRGPQTVNATLALDAPDNFTYRLEELPDAPPEARALRAAWLRGR